MILNYQISGFSENVEQGGDKINEST